MKNTRKNIINNLKNKKEKENIKKTQRQIVKNKLKKQIDKQNNNKEIDKLKKKKQVDFGKINKKHSKNSEITGNITRKKKVIWELIVAMFLFTFLAGRLAYIQFIEGKELQSMAYMQQTLDRKINPKRGTIYDSTGKNILAVSSTVETITVNPVNIPKENKEKVAEALTRIFNLDYETVLKRVTKRSSIETIVKKVDKEKADELRVWMKDNNITSGINIDEDTKRYYPYNNLASQIIGFCGSDNQGLDGIEAWYDKELKGSKRKNNKSNRCKRRRNRKFCRKLCTSN
ncbi:MAG: hypothetical protein HFJ41_06395 [Clostridia bacterium]|nr:hypothetical protein [Clostridia bacterium]